METLHKNLGLPRKGICNRVVTYLNKNELFLKDASCMKMD
jgi:hypothetical protein